MLLELILSLEEMGEVNGKHEKINNKVISKRQQQQNPFNCPLSRTTHM